MIIYENCKKEYYNVTFSHFNERTKNPSIRTKTKPKADVTLILKEALEYICSGKENFKELKLSERNQILYGKFIILECKIRCDLSKRTRKNELSALQEKEINQVCEIMNQKNLFYLEILALQANAEYMIRFFIS